MLRNFIITSLRILWRNKLVSAINIISLSIGITAFILILMYVHHETSYDKFNENYERIYRLEGDEYARLPTIIGDHLRDKIPEIEHLTLVQQGKIQNFINVDHIDPNKSVTIQAPIIRADSSIFKIFSFPFVYGKPETALNEPFSIVLTEKTSEQLFGDINPIGEIVTLETQLQSNNEYQVTGVIKNINKSHLQIDALISLPTLDELNIRMDYNYHRSDRFWNGIYLLLIQNSDVMAVQKKINTVLSEINNGEVVSIVFDRFHLQAIKDIYLFATSSELEYSKRGNGKLLWSFLAIGLFVIALAIINYVNLTTARSSMRFKEIALKKAMGSANIFLILQFIFEALMITFISFLLSLTTIQIILPHFNQLVGVSINLLEYSTPIYWIIVLLALIAIGSLAGFYPSMILTSLPSQTNIGRMSITESKGTGLRKTLLIVQFSITIMLIVGIISNFRQMKFVKNASLGFNKDQVLLINTPWHFSNQFLYRQAFKEKLLQNQSIKKISFSNKRFGFQKPGLLQLEIDGIAKHFQHFSIDPDYLDLMEIEIVEGRNFDWVRLGDRMSDSNNEFNDKFSVIINETASDRYWAESPVNKTFNHSSGRQIEIVGVFKDFHFLSMHHKVEPMMLTCRDFRENALVKVSSGDIQAAINVIEKEWKNIYGPEPFAYSFLDETYEQQYKSDERTATIIGYFTLIAIVIACMGLFGLSSFMAVRRTKEIGIRKALGASSKTIFVMLSREYIKWILLSAVIASPIAWYAMNKWLESFAYRIELGPGVFILAAVLALAIGLITVGWQALKSAVANPVEALRYE